MIDWMRYVHKGGTLEREERWLGRVNDRPAYVIMPHPADEGWLVLVDATDHTQLGRAEGDKARDTLRDAAELHRASLGASRS